jgi:hypothetical protein
MKYYIYFHDEAYEVEVEVQYHAVYQPAKLNGPPDRCYPDESSMDIEDITIVETRVLDLDTKADPPTLAQVMDYCDKHESKIKEECWNDFHDNRQDEIDGCCGRYYYA